MSVISDEIMRFTENGLVTADGKDYEFEIVACATGLMLRSLHTCK